METKNKPLVLLVDGENILHQSFHKFENLKSTDGKPSGAIFGFFKSLHMYLTRFEPNEVYITFDNGHSPFRDKLNRDYKAHRKDLSYDRESLIKQKGIILKILGMLRVNYVFDINKITNYEGDDFLAKLAIDNNMKGNRVLLVSSDKDFNQLLDCKNVKIYNPRKEGYVTAKNCKELFGYTPKETVAYLSMVGDKSDDIPGIKGIGPVKARKILDENPDFWGYAKTLPEDQQKILDRNKKLIDLRYFLKRFRIDVITIRGGHGKGMKLKSFKEVCIEYSFNSFLTNEFMKPFKLLNHEIQ
jgi:DNA polymerase-1